MNTAPKLSTIISRMKLMAGIGIPVKPECISAWAEELEQLALAPPSGDGVDANLRVFREMADAVHSRFFWMQSPDKKGNHTVSHESVQAVIALCEEIEAETPAYENMTTPQSAPEDGEQSFIDEWESRFGFLATHNNPRSIESIDEVACLLITPPQATPADGDVQAVNNKHGRTEKAMYFSPDGKHYVRVVCWLNTPSGKVLRHTSFCECVHKADAERLAMLLNFAATPPPASQEKEGKFRKAWYAVCTALDEVSPGWLAVNADVTATDLACTAIRELASPPSSAAAAKEPEQRCPYCAGLIYSDAGCQNCKVGSVWPKPDAAEQAKPDMGADDAFAAHIANLDQDELEAEQAQAGELEGNLDCWLDDLSNVYQLKSGSDIKDADYQRLVRVLHQLDALRSRLAGGVFTDAMKECDTCGGMVACPKCDVDSIKVTPAMIERAVDARGAYIVAMANKGKKRTTKGAMRAALVAALGAK